MMKQCGGSLKGIGVLAVQNLRPFKAQQPVVWPLVAVKQQPFFVTDQKNEARTLLCSEKSF